MAGASVGRENMYNERWDGERLFDPGFRMAFGRFSTPPLYACEA